MEVVVVASAFCAAWYYWEASSNAGHFAEAFCFFVAPAPYPPPVY